MDYSGYFSENGVPFARGGRYQIGHCQSSCVGVLRGQELAQSGTGIWNAAASQMGMGDWRCLHSVSQGRLVLQDIYVCYLGWAGGEGWGSRELLQPHKLRKSLLEPHSVGFFKICTTCNNTKSWAQILTSNCIASGEGTELVSICVLSRNCAALAHLQRGSC